MQISSKQTAGHSSPKKKLCVFHCRGGNSDIMFTLALEEREEARQWPGSEEAQCPKEVCFVVCMSSKVYGVRVVCQHGREGIAVLSEHSRFKVHFPKAQEHNVRGFIPAETRRTTRRGLNTTQFKEKNNHGENKCFQSVIYTVDVGAR